jgi:hypothetical protein
MTIPLPGGTVTFNGRISITQTGKISFAITGGTGSYSQARGTVSEPASDNNNAQNATNVFRLILP